MILTTHFCCPFQNSNKLNVFLLKWPFKNGQYVFDKQFKCNYHLPMSLSFLFQKLYGQRKANNHVTVFLYSNQCLKQTNKQTWNANTLQGLMILGGLEPDIFELPFNPSYSMNISYVSCYIQDIKWGIQGAKMKVTKLLVQTPATKSNEFIMR